VFWLEHAVSRTGLRRSGKWTPVSFKVLALLIANVLALERLGAGYRHYHSDLEVFLVM